MPSRTDLSEAANWFLEHLKETLNDFSAREGVQIFILNKEGELVNEISGVQRACKLILSAENGRIRCKDHFKTALSLVKKQKKVIFTECYAGFVSIWTPIIIRDSVVGAVISCGGKYNDGQSREKQEKKLSKLADEIDILQKEDFKKAAIDEVLLFSQEETENRAKRLKELFDILIQTANTPLKEVFG